MGSAAPERSEGSEHSEDNKNYWYPAFKLNENPFRYFETRLEEDKGTGPYIETRMDRKVCALLAAKVSAIVKGPRGCGKSCLVSCVDSKPENNLIRVVTPKNIADLYDQVFFGLDLATREESTKKLWGDDLGGLIKYARVDWSVEQRPVCGLCPERCVLPFDDPKKCVINIGGAPPPCKARKMIVQNAIYEVDGCMLDVPDDISARDLKELAAACEPLIQGSILILFATQDQARMLARSDVFSRLPVIEFKKMDDSFFVKLFKGRIDAAREDGGPYPFDDDAIKKIASLANYNVREFIRICSLVLVEMWQREMASPCTLDFLGELNIRPAAQSDRATIIRILKRHEGRWVGVQDLAREISEAIGAPFTERKVGAMMRDFGFDQFKRDAKGRSQVLISPNVLSAAEHTEHSEGSEG